MNRTERLLTWSRGDKGQNIYVGDESNTQDGIVIHGLETLKSGEELFDTEGAVNSVRLLVHVDEGNHWTNALSVSRFCPLRGITFTPTHSILVHVLSTRGGSASRRKGV